MELLEKQIHDGDRMLDLGTGSGILSIAGLLLGAKQAVMVDIFENSVRTALENTEKNGFSGDTVSAFVGNISDDEELRRKIGTGFDIITANIVADVIISMSPYFSGFLKKQGRLIVSGIITERLDEVLSALKENGIIVFIDRPLEKLVTTDNRPLSKTRELLKKRYDERYGLYNKAADITVKADDNLRTNITEVKREFTECEF